jgi:hypothetical protein
MIPATPVLHSGMAGGGMVHPAFFARLLCHDCIVSFSSLFKPYEVTGTGVGCWPVPAYMGGRFDGGSPRYGEDNNHVDGALLGMSSQKIKTLA